jgi:hypothetical protein
MPLRPSSPSNGKGNHDEIELARRARGGFAVVGGQLGIGPVVNTLITKQSPKRSK